MKLRITRMTALYPSSVFVQWDITPEPNDVTDYWISVERSGGPEGPWELLASNLKNAYHFLDSHFNAPIPERPDATKEGLNLLSLSKQVYYRITGIDGHKAVVVGDPTPIEPDLDVRTRLLKRKMQFDEGLGFKVLNGISLSVLKRRHWGIRCKICYDPVTKDGLQEHCKSCFGTTFEGGYWSPVLIRGRKDVAPVQTQMSPHGKTDRAVTTFTLLDYPKLEHGDVVVDLRKDDRYFIEMVTTTELKGIPVHQKITGSLLARDAVEYEIPANTLTTPRLY